MDVKNLIEQTARKVGRQDAYDENGHSPNYGYGCIDAEKAVEALLAPADDDSEIV